VQVSATAAWGAGAVPRAPVLEPTESAAGISRVAAAETGTPSEAVPGDTAELAHAAAAAAATPACPPEAEGDLAVEAVASAAEAAGAGRHPECRKNSQER
jgi:hypothetical protein